MTCKECYGRGIKHHFDVVSGIATVGPCKCNKPKPRKQWIEDLVKNLAEYNNTTEDDIREFMGEQNE